MDQRSAIVTQGIHHVSINVNNVDAALDFYVGVLNLELKHRPDLGFPGAWIQAGEQEIHLLGIDSGVPVKEQHFAFAVTDADTVHEALAERGFNPSAIREIPAVCRQFFTHDPSGNMIEFNQRL
jgi:glyoxylase I family protein